jgi:serine protease Do
MKLLKPVALPIIALLLLALVSSAWAETVIEPPKDLSGYKELESKIKGVVEKVLPAVVGIRVGQASGSGVIVSEDGIVMTAGHVVAKPGQEVTFIFADGKTVKGKTLGMYTTADVGLMRVAEEGKKWPFVEMGHSAEVKVGQWCIAIGHPLGYRPGRPPVVRVGRVMEKSDTVIRTDCPLVGGDSGGPLLDLDGKVIGINSRIGGPADVNLHAPTDVFRENWDRLLKGEAWSSTPPSRESPEVKKPFRDVVRAANQCTVRVKCDGKDAALGTIVGPDGWILTKASELHGKVICRLRDGRDLEARIVGIHPQLDLAMLKIDALGLPVIPWKIGPATVGAWLISGGLDDDPLAVGIVSVPRLAIPGTPGVIGVQLSDKEGPAQIVSVVPKSPADAAGIKPNDIITHVDDKPVANSAEARAQMQRHRPGDFVKLSIKRGEQSLDFRVQLGQLSTPGLQRQQSMNSLGVGVSKRSDNFPAVIQHDTVLKPVDCGGPVVDLSGAVVGINIAHGGRTETYCLPTDLLIAPMYELMSGRLSPELLKAAQKAAEEKAAAERKAAEEKAAKEKAEKEKAEAEKKAAEEKAAKEKAEKEKAEAEKKAAEEKAAKEKAEADKKAAEEKAAAEKKAAEEKAAAEKKAAEEKAAKEKAEAEKKAAEEKAAAEKKAAEEKAAKEKAEAEKKAAEEKKPEQKPESPAPGAQGNIN